MSVTRDFTGLAPACVAEAGPGFPILTQKVFFNVCIIGNKISIKYIIKLKPLRIISSLCLNVCPSSLIYIVNFHGVNTRQTLSLAQLGLNFTTNYRSHELSFFLSWPCTGGNLKCVK